MDSNFDGNNMEQWQEIENSPFKNEEMDELPIPAAEDEEPEKILLMKRLPRKKQRSRRKKENVLSTRHPKQSVKQSGKPGSRRKKRLN